MSTTILSLKRWPSRCWSSTIGKLPRGGKLTTIPAVSHSASLTKHFSSNPSARGVFCGHVCDKSRTARIQSIFDALIKHAGGDGGRSQQPSNPVRGISLSELYGIDGERRKSPAQGSGSPFTQRRRRLRRRRAAGRLQQSADLHRRPLAAARRRNAALLQAS